jgi:hypothetical protein
MSAEGIGNDISHFPRQRTISKPPRHSLVAYEPRMQGF